MDSFVLPQDTPKMNRNFFPWKWHGGMSVAYALRVIINPFRKSVWQCGQKSQRSRASSFAVRLAASVAVWLLAYSFVASGNCASNGGAPITDENPLAMPEP